MLPDFASLDEMDMAIADPSESVLDLIRAIHGPIGVLGAGGKMGFHLTLLLQRALDRLERNDEIVAVSRFSDKDTRSKFESAGLRTQITDLSSRDDLDRLPDFEVIFYLAGIKFGTADRPDLLQKMNVETPQRVAHRFRASRIVALSTGCVYPFMSPDSSGANEESPTEPPGEYAQSCVGRERAFAQASSEHATPCSLIRLNYSNDLRYGVLVDIAKKIVSDEPIDLSTGYVNVIWQGDALDQIVRSLAHASSPPFVLNVTGPDLVPVRELSYMLGEALGRKIRFSGDAASTAWISDSSRAIKLFGRPRVSLEQMVSWIARWIESGGQTLRKPTHFESRQGNY